MGLGEIILLVGVGVFLILIEIIFIPGTTFVGIIGFIATAIGVVLSYKFLPTTTANYILFGSLGISSLLIYLSFKFKLWNLFSLKSELKGTSSGTTLDEYQIGMEGVAVSALRPMGTVEFGDEQIEVTTFGEFISPKQRVRIIEVQKNKIVVELIKE